MNEGTRRVDCSENIQASEPRSGRLTNLYFTFTETMSPTSISDNTPFP